MRLQSEFQYRRQRGDQAEEEDDRERVSHSFSPDLSTAESPKRHLAPWKETMFTFCSYVKRQIEPDAGQAVRYRRSSLPLAANNAHFQ
jgi:hypothetical protein